MASEIYNVIDARQECLAQVVNLFQVRHEHRQHLFLSVLDPQLRIEHPDDAGSSQQQEHPGADGAQRPFGDSS